MEQFEAYFQRADSDRDGRVSGNEAITFFQATSLPKQVLAQIWTYADQNRTGFLGRPEFYNALKLVTVAQSKRELTPEIVKAALYGPASAKIPAPKINLAAIPGPQSNIRPGASPGQMSGTPAPSQGSGISGPHGFPSQQTQLVRPPRPSPPSSGLQSQLNVSNQGMPGTGFTGSYRPTSNLLGGSTNNGSLVGTSATQGGFDPVSSPMTQAKTPQISASFKLNDTSTLSSQVRKEEPKSLAPSGNGVAPNTIFGDVFSATPLQPKKNSMAPTYSAGMVPTPSAMTSSSSGGQPTVKPSAVSQSPATQGQQFTGKSNQHVLAQNPSAIPVATGNLASAQSQHPWPRMTQSDIQKYSKVFVQVDTDRDGKISGDQARNLFLSWRLPRGEQTLIRSGSKLKLDDKLSKVLKQVWDLSDQDNDSMLSLREFCIALYLMERYREGRPLPAVLPNSVMLEGMLPAPGQPVGAYGNTPSRPSPGFQQPQGTKNASRPVTSVGGRKPPRPVPISQPDESIQQKAKVPVLEKHLLDQLSTEEQDSLNKKFQEAKDAEKKVADLEKDILEARQKIQYYHAKMQELILYKSRCDNRLNEITEKVVTEKREAESLANKYEEKYKKDGDVASNLTIQEATFRDIQEKKMELYRSIVKLEQHNADGIQDQANLIQSDLEQLVKSLNERCKTYGLRGKPTSLVELPFGWQPGIEAAAADWDEVWDKFEDEGFTYVKELTLDVQNVIAPPKPKSALIKEQVTPSDGSGTDTVKSPSKAEDESELPSSGKRLPENERSNAIDLEQTARSPPDSPAGSNAVENPSMGSWDMPKLKDINVNGSPHAFDTKSEYGGDGDKSFDEPSWGSFDTHYDTDAAAWDFNPGTPKDADRERHNESSLFGGDDWGSLNPIKTGSTSKDTTFSNQGPFFDSVPSTPLYNSALSPTAGAGNLFSRNSSLAFADSVPGTPMYNFSSTPRHEGSSAFADSVPSTPMYNFSSTPRHEGSSAFADSVPGTPMYNFSSTPRHEGSDEQYSFDSFSRFDSFNMHDSGPFGSRETLSRFDSMRSSRDYDFDQGYTAPTAESSLARFDSFRSTADSDYNFGSLPPSSLTRFDSMRSTRDSEYGHGFPSFDDTNDPFGSGEPFKTSHEEQSPRRDSDSWKAF
ncbi:hypothetical protein ACJIZ3_023408 [Penstemon smallii]|uniref:Uncharacterized protein n=1 Tax=Penstemon smallii TaxID=265156 RepID=A0ABD3TP12_9LAMI